MTEDDDSEWPDSGPFCRHWSEVGDCDEKCARCGHTCSDHGSLGDDSRCRVCDCPAWVEAD